VKSIKDKIDAFADALGMRLEGKERAGRNESKQYIYYFIYDAATLPVAQSIKLEISLRYNPLIAPESRKIQHLYTHPFTGVSLFDAGRVNCLALNEIVSEKLRAAALRKDVAPRDFYDIDFILRINFNLQNKRVIDLFRKKLAEDKADTDLKKYLVNMGRMDKEMKDMRARIKEELLEVLTGKEREKFNLDIALKRINQEMALMIECTSE